MENCLFRENTTQLADINIDLSKYVGLNLESGFITVLKEFTDDSLALEEAIIASDSKIQQYIENTMDGDSIDLLEATVINRTVESIKNIIRAFIGKIIALGKLLWNFMGKIFDEVEDLLKVPFNFILGKPSPTILWFSDGYNANTCGLNILDKFEREYFDQVINFFKNNSGDYRSKIDELMQFDVSRYTQQADVILKTVIRMKASECPDFQNVNNARIISKKIRDNIRGLTNIIDRRFPVKLTYIEKHMNGAWTSYADNAMNYDNDNAKAPLYAKLVNKAIKDATILLNTIKNMNVEILKIYVSNINKCSKGWGLTTKDAQAQVQHNSSIYDEYIDADMIDEFVNFNIDRALKLSTFTESGDIKIIL